MMTRQSDIMTILYPTIIVLLLILLVVQYRMRWKYSFSKAETALLFFLLLMAATPRCYGHCRAFLILPVYLFLLFRHHIRKRKGQSTSKDEDAPE